MARQTGTAAASVANPYNEPVDATPGDRDWVGLFDAPLPADEATAWVTLPGSGAVVSFQGVVRDHSEGRPGVTGITYEAYPEQAQVRLHAVVSALRDRWPSVDRVVLLHRVGDLAVGEASVVVVVSGAHRPEAFEAARFGIDTIKETVPIWKREHWAGGSDWAECGHDVAAPPTGATASVGEA